MWVPEWHPGGHGLHLHFAVGRYVKHSLIKDAWGRGIVHIKLLGDLPVGSGALEEARLAARYLGKYAGKALDGERPTGLHRYEVGQGFKPQSVTVSGRTFDDVIGQASTLMGADRRMSGTHREPTGGRGRLPAGRSGMADDSLREAAREWVEASCASQGLPLRVADPAILAQVAGLLGAGPGVSREAPRRSASGSGTPDGGDAAVVEAVVATTSGGDDQVVEDGGDDRMLPGQRQ